MLPGQDPRPAALHRRGRHRLGREPPLHPRLRSRREARRQAPGGPDGVGPRRGRPEGARRARQVRRLDALFLDRDGTLIVERGFLSDPRGVRLTRGAAGALRRFTARGTLLFVVTNQSGIARGKLTRRQADAVNAEVARRLASRGVPVAGFLVCPHHPEGSVREYAVACRCRKPGTLLHRRAIRKHGLDPRRCAVVGDKWDDVGAGLSLGAHRVHVLTGHGRAHRRRVRAEAPGTILAPSLPAGLARLEERLSR
ncbi:MAG: HAD-IIIA family hydrolase [Acidobacteria bacterium ACB2]|nr:HAD-IIIA family hydrolase [Acidobacteria bacterium ACB2]